MAGVWCRNTNAECRTVQTRNAECGRCGRTGELRSQAAFSAKTLRAADLLPTAGVGSAVTARCGALRAATRAWGKVPASRQGSGAREAVGGVAQSICRLKAAFLARPPSAVALLRRTGHVQAAVAAGAAVAAVPGGVNWEMQRAE